MSMGQPRRRGRAGFTLVEILFVVLIIGMLLSIAVPSWFRARGTARAKGCQNNLKQIIGAKERWAMDNRKDATDTPAMTDLATDYLKVTPECPSGGAYTIGNLSETPTCSIGGTPGDTDAHAIR